MGSPVEADKAAGGEKVRGVAGARVVGVAVGKGAVGDLVAVGEELPGANRIALDRAAAALRWTSSRSICRACLPAVFGDDFIGIR